MTVQYTTDMADPRTTLLFKATQDSTGHQNRRSIDFSDSDLYSSDAELDDWDQCEIKDDSEDEWIDVSDARDFAQLYKKKEDLKAGEKRQKTNKGAKLDESWELVPVPGNDRGTDKGTSRKTGPGDEDQRLHLLLQAMTLEDKKYWDLEPPPRVFAPHKLSPDLDYTPEMPAPGEASTRSTLADPPSEAPQRRRTMLLKPRLRSRPSIPAAQLLRMEAASREVHKWGDFLEADKRSKLEDSSSSLYTHAPSP
ncbi:hypothetical protein PFICI_02713 [Pestalotiopsis fici W106-1]|uniref:Uncharacterized protein n=1 Tax=Pestalotiopsis fici (strain W106-1 / CGMCC3.15140) TaxID=1229662 RepID=W3XF12_PESFW|nr:uncharacterized protein PFICI_02713 [Pestalotiopsis fici W106-1]ETS84688.1 hypothetical protein PFICI_02713 [Pestalotiopsis fici W106-1]